MGCGSESGSGRGHVMLAGGKGSLLRHGNSRKRELFLSLFEDAIKRTAKLEGQHVNSGGKEGDESG